MRKLASIQKIKEIFPIPDADRLELVQVLGWKCVGGKGEFHVGDMVVYFEIDSFLPVCEEFEFLRKSSYKSNDFMGEGFRLKTMKFRGEISQGLCLGIEKLSKLQGMTLEEGMDVTEILGVREWETPERVGSGGTMIGDRPGYIPKTDETRIQSAPELLNEFKGLPYYITTKMDGSSHSIGVRDGDISFTGHNFTYKDDGKSAFVEHVKAAGIPEKMKAYVDEHGLSTMVLQGEWCGEGIQKNRLKLKKPEWFVFTARVDDKRTDLTTLREICEYVGCQLVPVEEEGNDLLAKYPDEAALLARAEGIGYNGTTKEGIVIRPVTPVHSYTLSGPLSMKVINNKYLMKNDE
ncbi:RNA ligase (ATP) [Oribacterium sp. P6A1]|uniref:RNA ligase (ATP) n=1 Tax=Oribacterium sp. P6A1 TaxID=1410612 RepID=UPI00056C5A67|nr:RNA ligase (ATP) [Oribacterium sp. P6A1]